MFIGIDIGGTSTRVTGSPSLNNIIPIGKSIIPTPENFEEGFFEISEIIKSISGNPMGIGIGIAGRVSENGKDFVRSTNLSSWTGKPIVETLEKEFGCPVFIANDAVAQSLGEAYYGLKPNTDFLYLAWGTGLGGALVTRKGGEIKSAQLDRSHLREWERNFGGKNIKRSFGKKTAQLNEKEWDVILPEFQRLIRDLSDKFNIEPVVINGGIVNKQKGRISKILNNTGSPKILFSKLGENTGPYGGLALIKTKLR
ncbi:MAG: ROK family protein [bacterium]|nr:ROK family protein [bacterium]